MKVYISGKITGDSRYKEKFREAARYLTNRGHIVLDPSWLPAGLEPEEYMNIDFAMMSAADCVYFLNDHTDSSGAALELAWCKYVNKIIAFEEVGISQAEAIYAKKEQCKHAAANHAAIEGKGDSIFKKRSYRSRTKREDAGRNDGKSL